MRPALLLVFAAFGAGHAFGWGCEGHQMVALIARENLSAKAATEVDRLLAENPPAASLKPYCKDVPQDSMAVASTWADDVRRGEKNGTWHYVDIPLDVTATSGPLDAWCEPVGPARPDGTKPGCVTSALAHELELLRNPKLPAAERTDALRYVIHLVGDMHQPLHDSDNSDSGGNCTAVKFLSEAAPSNMHSVWDFKLIQHDLELRKSNQISYASDLSREYTPRFRETAIDVRDPVKWAWEGHELAVKTTYGALKPPIPVEKSGVSVTCEAERAKVAALGISIGAAYFDQTIPTVRRALAESGFRLAALLNATF